MTEPISLHFDLVAPEFIPSYPARPINGGTLTPKSPGLHPAWSAEPKYNGWRVLVHVPSGRMFNRHGQLLTISHEFTAALRILKNFPFQWLDCEALDRRHGIGRGTLIILDCLDDPHQDYLTRRKFLSSFSVLSASSVNSVIIPHTSLDIAIRDDAVYIANSYNHPELCAMQLFEILKACNHKLNAPFYEGILLKRNDSPYPMQLRSDSEEFGSWIKHRWQF